MATKHVSAAYDESLERLKITAAAKWRQRVEASAFEGESVDQTEARLRAQDKGADAARKKAALVPEGKQDGNSSSCMRKAPAGDEQRDFFVSQAYDLDTKDVMLSMGLSLCRLSKKEKRAGGIINYKVPNGGIKVEGGLDGMASVWDYDIVLMMNSHLTEAMNLYRAGKGPLPGRIFRPHKSEILKFIRRDNGARQSEEIHKALKRLYDTTITFITNKTETSESKERVDRLIGSFEIVSKTDTGRVSQIEITVPNWIYTAIVANKQPDVLTVHPDYFLIESGYGRFIYRIARRAAGKKIAKWSYNTLHERSGVACDFPKFCQTMRKVVKSNDLPEYDLQEEPGLSGPQLVMRHRDYTPRPLGIVET